MVPMAVPIQGTPPRGERRGLRNRLVADDPDEDEDLERDELAALPVDRGSWRGLLRYLWPKRDLSRSERREVLTQLFPEPGETRIWAGRHFALMGFSVAIATYGLLNDSAAVVIGAMLVAPLMTPMMGYAAAMVMAWPRRQAWSLGVVTASSAYAIAVAIALSLVVPAGPEGGLPGEVLARTSPNVLDLFIALAAGGAGAYVTVHTRVGGALPGVAIAVALVPPLATIGILIRYGEWDLAAGAVLLFLTNWAAIVFAAGAVFLISGVTPRARAVRYSRRIKLGLAFAVLVVVVIAVPLGLHSAREFRTASVHATTAETVDAWIGDRELRVLDLEIDLEGTSDQIDVSAVVAGPEQPPAAADLASGLADALDREAAVQVRWLREQPSQATASPTG